ncbi:MAG: WG repeat-containing protein [Eubacteriales bacterium]|nr:WG repeat-containing protein [Eubacteriales bacterium]
MFSLLIKISTRLVSAAILIVMAMGFIYLASTRSLPFLPEEGQEYSIIDDNSESDISEDQSHIDISGDNSESGNTSGENDFDIAEYLESFDSVSPSNLTKPVSEYKYDKATQKLLLYNDISALGNLTGISLDVRMGFVFAGDRIFTANLTDVTELLGGYTFTGQRDLYGNPLFSKGGAYYYLDSSSVIQPSDFSAVTDKRGFDFDIPIYLGVQDSNIKRIYYKNNPEGQKFGYYGNGRVYANYCTEAFAFTNGRGCVIRTEKGVATIEIYSDFFYEHGGNLIASGYYPPLQRGLYSIGFFYFDDGFTRVRIKNTNGTFEEALIDINGKLLRLLDDYALVSYSDSMLLVGNGMYYGYMTNNLNWVTNPVFIYAEPFLEGLAVVGTRDGKYGVIDTQGNYVIKPVFDSVIRCSGGLMAAYSESDGWSVFVKVYL